MTPAAWRGSRELVRRFPAQNTPPEQYLDLMHHADLEVADCGGDDDSHDRPLGCNLSPIGELD